MTTKISELYRIWLKPGHLPENEAREVTIASAKVETLHPRPGQESKAVVLSFKGKPHSMIVNMSNANRLYTICGDDLDSWPGQVIALRRGMWGAKATILVERPAAATNGNGKK